MLEGSFHDTMATQPQQNPPTLRTGNGGRRMAISARKLAATLWELQEISLSSSVLPSKGMNEDSDLHPPETPIGKRSTSHLPFAPSPASSHIGMRSLRRSSVKCKFGDGVKRKPATIGQNAATAHTQVLKLLESVRPIDCPDDKEDTHEIEVDDGATINTPDFIDDKAIAGSKAASTTSSELLKVLNRVWSLEEQHKSSITVVNNLQSDLEGARSQVKGLTIQQMSHHRDLESLSKKLADEKAEWQEKEQEKTRQALQSIREELEDERKSKRKLDLIHRKVTKELADVKKSLAKALQDLEREQKARELMEDVCDELAREVGEDKAKVEALKRESIKVREEVEEERKMLQVAEVWREERVQMKLAEARHQIEEKNTTLDKLRAELDAFLKAKRASGASQEGASSNKVNSNTELSRTAPFVNGKQSSSTLVSLINEAYEVADEHRSPGNSSVDVEIKGTISNTDLVNGGSDEYSVENDDGEDEYDEEDDLHSIELNKNSYMRKDSYERRVKGTHLGQIDDLDQQSDSDRSQSLDKVNSTTVERTENQGGKQGVETTSISQGEPMEVKVENRDRVKMWNFELELPWRTEAKGEDLDKRVLDRDIDDVDLGGEIRSNMKGEKVISSTQDEPENKRVFCTSEKERQLLGSSESNSSNGSNITSREPSSLNLEAVTNGVWSLQNLGSSREMKGVSGLSSSMQQCASPTRKWGYSLSSPDPGRSLNALNSRPTKASTVGGVKASKEKIVKGKLTETKTDSKQPRFRIGKGV